MKSFINTIKMCGQPKVRRWAYRVAAAGLSAGAVYGVVNGEKATALLVVCAALFGVADANVSES